MSHFLNGFKDELEKNAGAITGAAKGLGKLLIKHPWKALTVGMVGAGGYAAMKNRKGKQRVIAARPGRPSPHFYVDHHRRLGIKKKLTPLQRERLSVNFPRYREKR